jgi:hypothetical protein
MTPSHPVSQSQEAFLVRLCLQAKPSLLLANNPMLNHQAFVHKNLPQNIFLSLDLYYGFPVILVIDNFFY